MFLFSLKDFKNIIYEQGSDTPIKHAYQFVFSDKVFHSPELGIDDFQSKQ